jgi:hypothetical protein
LPFYRLSPLLASNPFLANSILFSLAGHKHQADLFKVKAATVSLHDTTSTRWPFLSQYRGLCFDPTSMPPPTLL